MKRLLPVAGGSLILSVALLSSLTSGAQAAELKDITWNVSSEAIDVRLSFDKLPTYSSSFRYAPDRFVLSFNGCQLSVPDKKRQALGKLEHRLLTRISTGVQAGPPAVVQTGFYLNMHVEPTVREDGSSYILHFPVRSSYEYSKELAPGMSLTILDRATGTANETVYLVKVEPGAMVRVYAAGADRYDGKARLRAPSSFAKREDAEAVINGGFFNWSGQHLSTFIEDGIVRAAGVYPNRPMLVVTTDGAVVLGRFTAQTALLVTSPGADRALRIPLSGKNVPFIGGKVIVYDHLFDRTTLPKGGMFYYLLTGERLSYAGEDPAAAKVQAGTLLIATDIIPEANPLRGIDPEASLALETKLTDAQGQAVQAQYAIGGGPQLVDKGVVDISTVEDSIKADISASERARTAVALTASGQLLRAVVKEDEASGFGGMTLKALANMLLREGAVTAINFDGGGSSALVAGGQLVNIPATSERPVSNVLLIKAAPQLSNPVPSKPEAPTADAIVNSPPNSTEVQVQTP